MRRAWRVAAAALWLVGAISLAPGAGAEEDESVEGEEAVTGPLPEGDRDFDRPESEVTVPGRSAPGSAEGPGEEAPAPPPRKIQTGRQREQREAEGTQALDRFKANTVIESQYRLDGKPLEVDPD